MTNEIIGIVGVLGLTLLLFVLRHLILPSERANKQRYVTPMSHREPHELNKTTVNDDAWLLWTPDLETDVRFDRGQSYERRRQQGRALRFDERRDDRINGGEIR